MALTPTDRLLAGYVAFVTIMIALRGLLSQPAGWWLLVMHALFGILLVLFTKLREEDRVGQVLHDLYPLLMLLPFYYEFGVFGLQFGGAPALLHDATIQRWEAAIFGGQISYEWIRRHPSVFWSEVLHLAYFGYYPIVILGPTLLVARGRRAAARGVLFPMMAAFVSCYIVFILYPVAGPYYAFPQPDGPVRDAWGARLVYGVLGETSSFGAAFPSSHVAATVAATYALWRYWRRLALWLLAPSILLTVGTVYCQMHYGVDAAAGTVVGLAAGWLGRTRISSSRPLTSRR
ncbi:MAG: phosphatase PAP2 family protein [Gemmatimonadetes bacterium]|nr:phosphatase PAP2 family protein [Gemmatimonadota bacterium]